MGADCMHVTYDQHMAKVVQVRGLSDEAHEVLTRAAEDSGISLSAFLRGELEDLARRYDSVRHNREVIRAAREAIGARLDTQTILEALHEGRGE